MKHGLNARRGHFKILRLDAKDLILALVPHPVAVDPVPIPGSHLACRNGHAAAPLALDQSRRRFLQLRRSSPDAMLKLGIEPLQLRGFAIKLREDSYLRAQHLRNDGS